MATKRIFESFATSWILALCSLSLVTPLVVIPGINYTHVFGKSLFLFALVVLAFPAYLYLVLGGNHRPRPSPLLFGMIMVFGAHLITTMLAQDPALAWWSYPARMTGLWALCHYGLFFLLLSTVRDPLIWRRLIMLSVAVSLLVALMAIQDNFDLSLATTGSRTRSGSSLHNPAFMGGYLLFNIFFCLWLAEEERRWLSRLGLLVILAVQVLALLLAATRGPVLGFALGVLVYGLIRLYQSQVTIGRIMVVLGVGGLGLLVPVWYLWGERVISDLPNLQRLVEISLNSPSIQTRLYAWQLAWQGFLEHPWLGWGAEHFLHIYNFYYDPSQISVQLTYRWIDRVHNQPLELLATLGILGFAAYVLCLTLIARHLWKLYRNQIMSPPGFALACAILVAYLVQNLFLFDHPASLIMLFFCLAWWQSQWPEARPARVPVIKQPIATVAGSTLGRRLFLTALAAGGSLWYGYAWLYQPLHASWLIGIGLDQSDPEAAMQVFAEALAIDQPYPMMTAEYFARAALKVTDRRWDPPGRPEAATLMLTRATEALSQALGHSTRGDTRLYLVLARLQLLQGIANPQELTKSLETLEHARAHSPKRLEIVYLQSRAHLLLGDHAKAIEAAVQGIALAPEVGASWRALSTAQQTAGLSDEALASLRQYYALLDRLIQLERLHQQRNLD